MTLQLPREGVSSRAFPRLSMILGGAAGNHTLTGAATNDWILQVWHLPILNEAAPPTYSAPVDLSAEFNRRPTAANTINNTGGTNTTGGILFIFWKDYDLGHANDDPWD